MEQIRENLIRSFCLVKNDVVALKRQIDILERQNAKLVNLVADLQDKQMILLNVTKKKNGNGKKHKEFVAAKEGSKFHELNCPFAKNIKPMNKVKFKSKITALNQGYKPCKCI
jgi:hypothetical protein